MQFYVPCYTGTVALYMFTDGFKRIHELMVFDEDGHRSWFVGNRVLSGWYFSLVLVVKILESQISLIIFCLVMLSFFTLL